MNQEEIKNAVREAIRDEKANGGLCPRCCQYCELTPQTHTAHHAAFQAAIENRSEFRRWVYRAAITLGTVAGASFVGMALWHYFRHRLEGK